MGSSIRNTIRHSTAGSETPTPELPTSAAPQTASTKDVVLSLIIGVPLIVLFVWGAISALEFCYHLAFGSPESNKPTIVASVPSAGSAAVTEQRSAASAPAQVATQSSSPTEVNDDGMTGPPQLRHPDTSNDQLSGDQAMAAAAVLQILHRVEKPCARIMWVQPDPNIANTFDVACRTKRFSTKEVAYIVEPVTGVVGRL